MTDPTPPQILGELVRRARGQVTVEGRQATGLTVAEIAKLRGMSHVTWAKVERGEKVTEQTYSQVDEALGLREGTSAAAATGGMKSLERFAEQLGWAHAAADEARRAVQNKWVTEAIRSRAKELGLDVSVLLQAWRNLDTLGQSLGPEEIEKRLQWAPGSLSNIRDGKLPGRIAPIGKATETDRARSVSPSESGTDRQLSGTSAAVSSAHGNLTVGRANANLGGLTAGVSGHGAATAPAARASGQGTVTPSIEQEAYPVTAEAYRVLGTWMTGEAQKLAAVDPKLMLHLAEVLTGLEGLLPALRRRITGEEAAVHDGFDLLRRTGLYPNSEQHADGEPADGPTDDQPERS